MPYPGRPDSSRIGGRGMLMVSAMGIAWGTRRTTGGKTVWAEMPVHAPAAHDH
jgi:hypothetical protein